jgi:1-acyl-sn-glycerol-3-phosphate acyltransferase
VEGESRLRPGPVVVLARHASPLDNLVPAVFASSRQRLRLRWVINRWLLRDPCLDIVGNRLPNVFVDAGSREPRGQSGRIAALAAGLGTDEGVLIYPEGALFSPSRLARAALRLDPSTDEAARAARLRSVLPPRSGAFIGALAALPEADVIVCSHRGLDAAGNYRALLSGALAGATVAIRFERIARGEIPVTPDGQSAWLWERWEMMDRWIAGE